MSNGEIKPLVNRADTAYVGGMMERSAHELPREHFEYDGDQEDYSMAFEAVAAVLAHSLQPGVKHDKGPSEAFEEVHRVGDELLMKLGPNQAHQVILFAHQDVLQMYTDLENAGVDTHFFDWKESVRGYLERRKK